MALYIITNKTIKMANNGKGIGPRGLGAPKSMAKYGSMAKQTEPKTGNKKNTSGVFGGDTIMGDENNDGNMVSRAIGAFRRGSQRSDEQALRAKNTQQNINNTFKRDIKEKGLIQAVKKNFKF
jgi:hypothetical protein